MQSMNQALSGSALGSTPAKIGQRYLPNTPTRTGSEPATSNSFAENLKNIKKKIASQDVFSGSTSPALPSTVKCEWPGQARTSVSTESPSMPKRGPQEVALNFLSAQKALKAGNS